MSFVTNQLTSISSLLGSLALISGSLSIIACSEDSGEERDGDGDNLGGSDNGGGSDNASDDVPPTGSDALYAMMIQVYTPDDRVVYVHLSKDLDVSDIDLSQAREFASVANFAGVDGRILVSSGTEPEIAEFGISDDLQWTDGRTVSFASYPLDDNANFYYQYILNDNTAYLPFDATSRVVWDPAGMRITSTLTDTHVPRELQGLKVATGGNRNAVKFNGPVQQPFFYVDVNWTEYGAQSVVAIYDEKTNEEASTVTLPCPALSMASQDGEYTYYGTWDFQDAALFGDGPEPCIARLNGDYELDEEWTTDLTSATDGRLHNNFRAIGGNRAIANVFHDEIFLQEHAEMSFDEYDPDVVEALGASGPWWKLWLFDLDAMTGAPVEGIDVDTGSGAQFAVLDGRTFVFLPYEEWGRSKIYEIDEEGQAIERGDTAGDVFKWVKIR